LISSRVRERRQTLRYE